MDEIALATGKGLIRAARTEHGWVITERSSTDIPLTSILRHDGDLILGAREGVFRCAGGQNWDRESDGLSIPYVRWLGHQNGRVFAGTEPAGIFHSDAGRWQNAPEVADLRDRFHWFLPYSPEAGCVRGFAFHGRRGYAAVEVGGVLRSDDRGVSWRLAGGSSGKPSFDIPPEGMVHPDVHSIEVHPSSPDLVFAVTAGGLFRSGDGGDTWQVSHAGSYCRAAWIDPGNPDHIVLGPADDVSVNGRIEETHDGGRTWQLASDGLDLPWPRRMVERFATVGDDLFAVTSDGCLFASPAGKLSWRRVLPEVDEIRAVAQL
ncbi:MAG TPA: hypothetical protein VFB58_12605 [Chloroflexota bacterium]|nr:hypothetical protein [Chloroflexota bacterium]